MIDRKILVVAGSVACIAGCIGDFLSVFILGPEYPGYSHLFDTMSSLGSSSSPVSDIISALWIILGILMIIFAFGFRAAYFPRDKNARIAFWLIIFYGLGEGVGSGLFKADRIAGSYATSFIVHDILGSIGVLAIVILPLAVKKIKPFCFSRAFVFFSYFVMIVGLLFLILFSTRFIDFGKNQIALYKGLWQRLFILVYYIYLMIITVRMVRETIDKRR